MCKCISLYRYGGLHGFSDTLMPSLPYILRGIGLGVIFISYPETGEMKAMVNMLSVHPAEPLIW